MAAVHLLSLSAAISYGVSDVCGAIAARRLAALWVTFWLQFVGLVLLLPVTIVARDVLSVGAVVTGSLSGIAVAVGLVAYFHAMTVSPIGLVSPIAAAVSVAVPVLVGVTVFSETLTGMQAAGMLSGLLAIVLVAYRSEPQLLMRARTTVGLSLLAGLGFGLFPVALSVAPADSGLWPLLFGRISASVLVFLVLMRVKPRVTGRPPFGLLIAAGVLDLAAQGLFLAALRTGALGVPALLTSLFPVVTVLAGRYLLQERLRAVQLFAVGLAFVAIVLIVAGDA